MGMPIESQMVEGMDKLNLKHRKKGGLRPIKLKVDLADKMPYNLRSD